VIATQAQLKRSVTNTYNIIIDALCKEGDSKMPEESKQGAQEFVKKNANKLRKALLLSYQNGI
jgi:hypothetical protein